MAIWLFRAGSHGEYEQKFITEKRIYVTWDDLNVDLSLLNNRPQLITAMTDRYQDHKPKQIVTAASQVWPFAHEMKQKDLIILPLKTQRSIQVGEIDGDYHFVPDGPSPFFHWRSVKWIGESIPRAHFDQDLLFSFGALLTICRVKRNNAEERIRAMAASGWKKNAVQVTIKGKSIATDSVEEATEDTDLDEMARDQIARLIGARFKGHDLTRLVEAILQAQGYTTYRSPEGPDGGADILAGAGPLGFGSPRLCVEVKSESSPIDRSTVDKLLGAVSKFSADEGLFVSWSGFKSTVQKELATSFFRVRMWSQKELLEQLFLHYESLSEDLRAELPLKRVWMVAVPEEE